MKNKIVIFKVLAAIIAVGGAFASVSANSSLVATSAYVRYTTADTANIYCVALGTCETTGLNTCRFDVQITGQGTVTTTARITVPPSNNTCPTAILATEDDSPGSTGTSIILPADAVIK